MLLERALASLPARIKRGCFWSRDSFVSILSTRPGELTSTPEKKRIAGILSDFVAGESGALPKKTLISDPHILDGGWLHPVVRLEGLEKEQGLPIVGLEWIDEDLRGKPISWCGPEMRGKSVRILFSLP